MTNNNNSTVSDRPVFFILSDPIDGIDHFGSEQRTVYNNALIVNFSGLESFMQAKTIRNYQVIGFD